ncbi:MAG: PIN domain-containing protein [Burkholderiaceae bacterium]|nr:PIN domain-containing protein [Burkholderiaceae bacterium]
MIAVDTNILVYAHRADSEFHRPALAALEALAAQSGGWAIPWPCVHEFLSVVTGPAFGARRTPPEVAFETLRTWLAHPRCTALAETDAHFTLLEALTQRAALRGGALHDARIAAICIGHRVEELWTCDRDFDRFPDLRIRNPLVPSLHEPAPRLYA